MSELELDRFKSITNKGKSSACVEGMAGYCRTDSNVVKRIRITARRRLELADDDSRIKNLCPIVYRFQAFTNLAN